MIFTPSASKNLATEVEHLGTDQLLQQLLVPVDFSPCADNAIRFAVAIALRTGARIKLFHSVQLPLQTTDMVVYPIDQLERDAARQLGDKAVEITTWLEKERQRILEVQHHVHFGFAAEEIVKVARKDDTDLIVMGTHGASGFGAAILGSNTSMVIDRVQCPVLAVPEDATFEGFAKIVYATDMQEVNRPAVKMLVDFARHFLAEIHVLHVLGQGEVITEVEFELFRDVFEKAAHYSNVSYHMIESHDASLVQAVDGFMDENGMDAIAMLTHHRGFLAKLFHRSQTKRFALHAHKPLLAFH